MEYEVKQFLAGMYPDIKRWREREVLTYKFQPAKRPFPFRVRRVVNPFEFYLELDVGGEDFKKFSARMQTYYKDVAQNEAEKLTEDPRVGHCYVCKSPIDGTWNRVRVFEVDREKMTVVVFFCDLGVELETSFGKLRMIIPEFAICAAQLFKAYLYDVLPVGKGDIEWSEEATAFFKELVEGRALEGIVMARSDWIVRDGFPDVVVQMGVVLIERRLECTINARMVDESFAEALGVFGGCKHQLIFDEKAVPTVDKDLIKKMYPSPPNATIQESHPSFPAEFYKRKVELWELAPRKNWLPVRFMPEHEKVPTFFLIVPEKIRKNIAQVKLSYCVGPYCIYYHLMSEKEDLTAMQVGLQNAVENKKRLSEVDAKPGLFVACKLTLGRGSIWCRAIVRITVNPGIIRVLLVDYGNNVNVNLENTRVLPHFFHDIPSFVHRMHLDLGEFQPVAGPSWKSEVSKMFREYTCKWEKEGPTYYIFRRPESSWIEVEDLHQAIIFTQDKRWVAEKCEQKLFNKVMNDYKNHPILRSFYHSVGVDLRFELRVKQSPTWYFETVTEDLIKKKQAIFQETLMGKEEIHLGILGKEASA